MMRGQSVDRYFTRSRNPWGVLQDRITNSNSRNAVSVS